MFFGSISDRNQLAKILAAPGGWKLSEEAAQILTVLAMEPQRSEKREFPRDSLAGIAKSVNHYHLESQRTFVWVKLGITGLLALNTFLGIVLALLKFL